MKKYILAIDAGTTSSRAIIFDKNGQEVGVAQYEFEQHFPKEGWVEHDPIEIWNSQKKAIEDVLSKNKIKASEIDSIGITNQRETTVVWNKNNGNPISQCNCLARQKNSSIFVRDLTKRVMLNDSK